MTTQFRNMKAMALTALIIVGFAVHCGQAHAAELKTLTVAGGCFWCVESDFESVPGVGDVVSGYTGGTTENPTYKTVTRGGSGHYEAVQIPYDPSQVSVEELLTMFFRSVDPTDPGGQFCDRGESYRTAIFYENEAERVAAEAAKAATMEALGQEIVTPILPAGTFYVAEDYHQDYYKGSNIIFTRFGPKVQSEAYKRYRKACGRDTRVTQLWGDQAVFAGNH